MYVNIIKGVSILLNNYNLSFAIAYDVTELAAQLEWVENNQLFIGIPVLRHAKHDNSTL